MRLSQQLADELAGGAAGGLRTCLGSWLGAPRKARTFARVIPELPEPLDELYECASAWPELFVQDHLKPADILEWVDGRAVFMIENRLVDVWATGRVRGLLDMLRRVGPPWSWLTEETCMLVGQDLLAQTMPVPGKEGLTDLFVAAGSGEARRMLLNLPIEWDAEPGADFDH